MKKRKKILIFLIPTLVLQFIIFFLLDRQADQLLNPFFRLDQAYIVKAGASGGHGFSLSHNNKYLGYIQNNELSIIDLTRNERISYNRDYTAETEVLAYKWLPDRNSLVYLAASASNETLLISLDLDTLPVSGSEQGYAARLERALHFSMEEVLGIEMSTYTNNLYILYQDSHRHRQLIKLDLMKNINRLGDPAEEIRTICVSNKFGTVYYASEQGASKKIVAVRDGERSVITQDKQAVLLGCENDTVFLGKLDERDNLRSIGLYQAGLNNGQNKISPLWQGELPFGPLEVSIGSNNHIIIRGPASLAKILPEGKLLQKKLPVDSKVVLAPTGDRYLEINPQETKIIYYWREL